MTKASRDFTESDIERALVELAFRQGVVKPAVRALKEDHGLVISAATLQQWRDETHVNRYERARESLVVRMAEEAEELAHEYAQIERRLAERLREDADKLDIRDVPGALRNVTTSRGISTTNANVLRGRPTSITESRGAEDIMRALAFKLGVKDAVDSDAVEVPVELEAGNDESPA